MIDYKSIWESLNEESLRNVSEIQIARKIPTINSLSIFLATDTLRNTRLLYIKPVNIRDIETDKLPLFRGMEIKISTDSIGEFENAKFIKFIQALPKSDNIFEMIISDICERIIRIVDESKLTEVLMDVLYEWKVFFEKMTTPILSLHAQKGLYGEMYFLKEVLFLKYTFTESIIFWTGSDKTNHDFQISNNAVEIKTTASKQHKKFIVSSERQLDSTGLDNLYLVLYSLIMHSSMPDKTLPAIIRDIYHLIKNDSVASYQFQIKLLKCGYDDRLFKKYKTGFSVSEKKYYRVIDGFPRLLQSDLPKGVGDIKYSVVLAACTHFEINEDIKEMI